MVHVLLSFETQQWNYWLEKPWQCKIETTGDAFLVFGQKYKGDEPEIKKCEEIGGKILDAMNAAMKSEAVYGEFDLEDEDFKKLNEATPSATGKKRFVFTGWANEERTSVHATLKYPTFGYL